MKRYLFFVTLSFFFQLQLCAQIPSAEDYIVVNKTKCTAQVTVHCTDMSSTSNILLPDEDWVNHCPTGELLCTVKMVLPGSSPIMLSPDYSLPCLNAGNDILPPNSCYSQNVQWILTGPYIICNIY